MRILYVITGGDIGGAQRHVQYLAEWFTNRKAEVHVVVGENGPFVDLLKKSGIPTTIITIPRKIDPVKDLKAIWRLLYFIKNGEYDIVHSHSSKAGIIARVAGFFSRVDKNIFTAHGFVFTDPTLSKKKRGLYLLLEKACSLISTDIITVSQYDLNRGMENRLNRNKMHVIYNGIPNHTILSYKELDVKLHSIKNRGKKVIGFVGRFASEKNIDMILRVALLFKNQNRYDVEFWLIGDGPLFHIYKEKIEKLDLGKIIILKGNQTDILSWMDQMNLLIITSHKEGLPFVLLEALSRGLPVVSTDVGGVKEVLDPADTKNIIIPINDDKAMYQRLIELLDNHVLYEFLSKDAIKLARKLTVEEMCLKTLRIYEGNHTIQPVEQSLVLGETSHEGRN